MALDLFFVKYLLHPEAAAVLPPEIITELITLHPQTVVVDLQGAVAVVPVAVHPQDLPGMVKDKDYIRKNKTT